MGKGPPRSSSTTLDSFLSTTCHNDPVKSALSSLKSIKGNSFLHKGPRKCINPLTVGGKAAEVGSQSMNAQEKELKVTDLAAQQLPSGHNLNNQLSSLKITRQDLPPLPR